MQWTDGWMVGVAAEMEMETVVEVLVEVAHCPLKWNAFTGN